MRIFVSTVTVSIVVLICSPSALAQPAKNAEQDGFPLPVTAWQRDAALFAALRSDTQIDFFETRLGDVLDALSSNHRIPIVLDPSAAENNLDEDTLITLKLENISLNSAFRIMLGGYQCRVVVANEVLTIMPGAKAAQQFHSRRYDCRLLAEQLQGESAENLMKLEQVIRTSVDPASWDNQGGHGGVAEVGGWLFVYQNAENHDHIFRILDSLFRDSASRE